MLITSIDPLRVYVNKRGLARFCTEEYKKPEEKNLKNTFMHLTNYSINKFSSKFAEKQGQSDVDSRFKRDFESVWKEIRKAGKDPEEVFDEIKKCCLKTICSVQPIMKYLYETGQAEDVTGQMCFEILGFDVILDENLKPFILEVNHAPSFNTDTKLDYEVKTEMLNSAIDLLSVDLNRRNDTLKQLKKLQQLRILRGNRERKSPFDRHALKVEFQHRFYSSIRNEGSFELVYPSQKFKEPYEEFMDFVETKYKEKFGMSKRKEKAESLEKVLPHKQSP